jgi:predicted nucleotidyltransferase
MADEQYQNNHEQSNMDDDQSGESGEDIANQIGRQATRQNIKVVCRIRPTNDKEIQNNGVDVLTHDHESIELKNEDYDLQFTFDRVFGKETSQVDMFERCAKPLIADIFAGYNATIFAYGQTGTGKVSHKHGSPSLMGMHGITNVFGHIDIYYGRKY